MDHVTRRNLLHVSTAVEIATGLLLILAPGLLCRLLLGVEAAGEVALLARLFGVTLICLGVACRPGGEPVAPRSARAMLLYNALIALFLAGVGLGFGPTPSGGVLLWPAVAVHAAIAALLAIRR